MNKIIKQLEEMGFKNIKLYEEYLDDQYYDAISWSDDPVEIVVKNDGKVEWRYLGNSEIESLNDVKWFEVGKVKKDD